MLIMCDRQDGIFTPQMSDRINIKTTALWEKINGMYVPAIYPKLKVSEDEINTANISIIKESSNYSLQIEGGLHVINFRVTFDTPLTLNNTTIGQLTTPPNGDILVTLNNGNIVIIVQKGTTAIKAFSNSSIQQAVCYFTYVV